MANRPAQFRQVDITKAAKGVAAAGYTVSRIDVCPFTGTISVFTDSASMTSGLSPLETWKRKKDAR
jgi:hypothetical protein